MWLKSSHPSRGRTHERWLRDGIGAFIARCYDSCIKRVDIVVEKAFRL